MKWLMYPISIPIFIVGIIVSLPFLLPAKTVNKFSDEELRAMALSRNMLAVPISYEALLEVVNTPYNTMSSEKIMLGKELFFDTSLSQDKTISCASCHHLEEAGDDNFSTAIGHQGQANPFHLNTPTVLNAALAKFQFWNGRAKDVEEQASGPIQASFEMHMTPKK